MENAMKKDLYWEHVMHDMFNPNCSTCFSYRAWWKSNLKGRGKAPKREDWQDFSKSDEIKRLQDSNPLE